MYHVPGRMRLLVRRRFSKLASLLFLISLMALVVRHLRTPGSLDPNKHHPEQAVPTAMEPTTSAAARPPYATIQTLVADLPRECIPQFPATSDSRRLVFVGDVHGQLASLRALLAKINFNARAGDHLVLAGDLTNKGPDSAGVVQLAMDLGAHAVRGNHDDKVLRTREALLHPRDGEDMPPVADGAGAVAASLSDAQARWLAALPVALRVPAGFPGARGPPWNAGELVVVHAGLMPGVPLARQHPTAAMKMRGLVAVHGGEGNRDAVVAAALDAWNRNMAYRRRGGPVTLAQIEEWRVQEGDLGRNWDVEEDDHLIGLGRVRNPRTGRQEVLIPVESHEAKAWSKVWNRVQNSIVDESARTVVIYGHDAKAGLQTNLDLGPGRASSELSNAFDLSGSGAESEVAPTQDTEKKGAKHDRKRGIRYAFGLDSGCVYGKQLSALIVEAGEDDIVHRIEQVECKAAIEVDHVERKSGNRKDGL